jgi:DNA polymerase III epsilon subunit family exonuclease
MHILGNLMENVSLQEATFVVVDLETTGSSPMNGANITEIGAVKVRGGEVIAEFKSFVNPLTPIPIFITQLTGIDNEMVRFAPIIDEIFPTFLEFCGSSSESILVAHNAPFDLGFLKMASKELEYEWPAYKVVDTVRLARMVLSREEVVDCKLGTLASFFNTEIKPTHRALDDAQTTVEVLHKLFERLGGYGIYSVGELEKVLRKRIKRESRLL